ncbi:phage/plasmid primase, P4 family [Oscillibacter sp. GMB15532]|uniref:phage/plasmid primase, P4 family n=1 Tax=Oscillibacter sp. GMB15532 TaxID=3230022 RepID=UPI0034DF88A8
MTGDMLLKHAKYYAKSMGLRIFPCYPAGKIPATAHGCLDATTEEKQISEWWTGSYLYNIGIATGNGIVVLDVDIDHEAGKHGDETLAYLEKQYGQLPDTWQCLTGGGGVHYYFQCNDPSLTVAAGFAPGLDYRGDGGYVIAPPSVHQNGRKYEWEVEHTPNNTALAPLPEWLHKLMLNGKQDTSKKAYEIPKTVTKGKRNEELFKMASSLRAKGLSVEEITAAVMKANETRCKPPLSSKEVETICTSAGRYERGNAQRAAPADSVRPPDFSDAGNATVFSRIYRKDLIFVDALGWLWWTGKKWERDDHKAMAWALDLSARMLGEAGGANREALLQQAEAKARYAESGEMADGEAVKTADAEVSKTKAYLAHAKNTRNAVRIKNMLELSKPALVLKADKLDASAFDLNTPAGIVNLTTGQLRPHDRAAYCSQMTQAEPNRRGADIWGTFLDTITCSDGSVRGFLQLVAGMSLIGSVYQEGIIIAYGGGRNGKSTIFNAIGQTLGDYTGSIDIKTITTDRANKGASLATLRGKRLVITGELEEHQRLSVATLKQLASTDKLVVEEKFKQPETVTQTHTLILFTNHLPRVGSTDSGTWRRLIAVPFNATIPAGSGVQNYADVLVEKAGGAILNWAIEGAVNFVRNGFKLDIPEVVEEATDAYREREDWLNNFINERCVRESNARVGAANLYREYREWAQDTGDYVRRLNDFTSGMETAGFQNVRPRNKSTWIGLRLDIETKFGNPYTASS